MIANSCVAQQGFGVRIEPWRAIVVMDTRTGSGVIDMRRPGRDSAAWRQKLAE